MTLDRLWPLVGLVALPALWILSRRIWQRREVVVSSLIIWRRLDFAAEPPREARRRADLLLLLRLAVALAAVLGAAGLRIGVAEPPAVLHVLVDESVSMSAFADETRAALQAIEASATHGARLAIHRSSGTRDLAAVLSAAGTGSVVVVTDHVPEALREPERVRLWLVGRPVGNIGVASAWMEEKGRYGAVIRNYGRTEQSLEVVHPAGVTPLTLGPGEIEAVFGHSAGNRAEILLKPGDRFRFDDRVVVEWDPGLRVGLRWVGPDEPRLRHALEIGGFSFEEEHAPSLAYRRVPEDGALLVVAHPGAGRRTGAGLLSVSGGISPDSVPQPATSLGPVREPAPGGTVLLADDEGPLAVLRDGRVEVGLDPGDPTSTWASDPAFPIFWSEVARVLGARAPGSVVREGTPDPAESATVPAASSPGLQGLEPSRGGEDLGRSLSPLLFAGAAVLAALTLAIDPGARRPRRRREA
jgi:hypothetical protein